MLNSETYITCDMFQTKTLGGSLLALRFLGSPPPFRNEGSGNPYSGTASVKFRVGSEADDGHGAQCAALRELTEDVSIGESGLVCLPGFHQREECRAGRPVPFLADLLFIWFEYYGGFRGSLWERCCPKLANTCRSARAAGWGVTALANTGCMTGKSC